MQEELEIRSVVLSIKTGKITARVLAKAMRAAYRQMKKSRDAPGKMSFKQLSKGGALSEIEITDDNIKAFALWRVSTGYDIRSKRTQHPTRRCGGYIFGRRTWIP